METLSLLTESLSLRFLPAGTPAEATHMFSTDEIRSALSEINPAVDPTNQQVHDAMISAGYVYAPKEGTASLMFRWLLRER